MRGLERVGSDCQTRVPLARSLGTSEGLELERADSRRPIRSITWCGMAVWTVRAEPAELIRSHAMRCAPLMHVADPVAGLLLLRPTLMLPPRGIKADAWPPGEPRIPPLPVMPHRGQVENVRAGLLEPRHRIHRSPPGNEGNTAKIGERRQEWERRPCALVSGTFVKGPL